MRLPKGKIKKILDIISNSRIIGKHTKLDVIKGATHYLSLDLEGYVYILCFTPNKNNGKISLSSQNNADLSITSRSYYYKRIKEMFIDLYRGELDL